jgi:anti-anti-sigma regulatory factor
MLDVHKENIGELAVVECEGRVVQNQDAFTLWEAVTSQENARIILLDLSELRVVEGAALGMLLFLQRWAHDHDIRFKLFNPSKSIHDHLEFPVRSQHSNWKCSNSMTELDIATVDEVSALLANADHSRAIAA